jgi:hypothetical protein
VKLQQFIKTPFAWWNNYWFNPAPFFDLAICRILIVGFQLIRFVNSNFWGHLVEYSNLPDFLYEPLPVLQLLLLPFGADYRPPLFYTGTVFGLTVFAGILGLFGFLTNFSLILFALGNIFIQAYLYSFRDFHHSEALVMISLIVIAISPSGNVLSIDDLRRRIKSNRDRENFETFDLKEENSPFARWPLLVIQWIVAIIYLDSAVSKLLKSGLDWMNGYTLQYYLWQDGLIWDRSFGIWFAQQHTLAVLSSWVAILFELTFFLVLIFPKLVWLYIPMGISFHTGIYIAQKAPFIKYFPSYAVFIPWAAIAKSIASRKNAAKSKRAIEVLYDPQNPNHLRLMTIFCYLDCFNRLTFSDVKDRWQQLSETCSDISFEEFKQEINIVLSDESMRRGFIAFKKICLSLPLIYPLAIGFDLPFISQLSRNAYAFLIRGQAKS